MWVDEASEFLDGLFRGGAIPLYLLAALPLLLIIAPAGQAAQEFSVYRMQHYDLQGHPHGSRSAVVNMEARVLESDPASYARRCVLARLLDLAPGKFYQATNQDAGSILVLFPPDPNALSPSERERAREAEQAMMAEEVPIPVYFATETEELRDIYAEIGRASASGASGDSAGSAAEALMGSVSASGYQVVAQGSQAKAVGDAQVASIQGKLGGYGAEEQLPTVAVVAHYDSLAVAPELSFGWDSNGSGVAVLLELARVLSRLYSSARLQPRFNVMFLLSGGGKINYQGSKKWLEDQLDGLEGSLLQDALFVLCLDTLSGESQNGAQNANKNGVQKLYLHVSKPPKEGTAGHRLVADLDSNPGLSVETVHKKINLAEEMLAWEHERFSMRRLPAFTLSAMPGHRHYLRQSLLDVSPPGDAPVKGLALKARALMRSLVAQMYNLSSVSEANELLGPGLDVEEDALQAWLLYLSSQPRSPQLLSGKGNPLVATLESAMQRWASEVKVTYMRPDRRDPEFTFYDVTRTVMNAYSVKPAVFDLILTVAILAYVMLVYFFIQNFSGLYILLVRLTTSHVKSQ